MDRSAPPNRPSDRLALIITGLRGVLATHRVKDRSAVPLIFLGWARLGRLPSRFQALVGGDSAGRLPPGRPEACGLRRPSA
ncbi:MAG: hypothetical protein JOY71_05910 [Acetobacteraceae bacterium]|nr:hypothetical protein [Acetobacteraceae bacterium]